MLKNILNTFGTRAVAALLSLLIVILTAHELGAEGRGVISLLVLDLTIILMFNEITGGTALVYLIPRTELFKLMAPSYIWALLASGICTFILKIFNLIAAQFVFDIFFLSLLLNLTTINTNLLTGKEKISQSNFVQLTQVILLFASLFFLLKILQRKEVISYIHSLYISYGMSFLLSIFYLWNEIKITPLHQMQQLIGTAIQYGFLVQIANTVQLLNYRLSYYILDNEHGKVMVGIYATGIAVCEAVWLISKSIARVQYARIANSNDNNYSVLLTVRLSKISLLLTVACLLPLLLLPESFFVFLFGNEFGDIRTVLFFTAAGVVALGWSLIYGHYFSGIGKIYINTIVSIIGFAFTLVFSFLLIPQYGLKGAGIATSLSYLATSFFLFILFIKHTKLKPSELLPAREDFIFFISEMKSFLLTGKKR